MKPHVLLFSALVGLLPSALYAQDAASTGPMRGPDRFVVVRPVTQQQQAVEYSDAYGTRVTIHRITSYVILPLFAAQYYLGDRLLNEDDPPGWVRSAHGAVATGMGLAYGTNTVTGVWNLIESRKDPAGRTRRWIHSAVMIGAGAGLVYTASLASDEGEREDNTEHRNAAIISMGATAANALVMLLWKD